MQSNNEKIIQVDIESQMKSAYIDYAMSVIVSRALPDVRDGMKPVHRRILFAMNEMGMQHNKPYKKSARIVGDVLGKYHPHGDSSVYGAMVRLAQPWAMRYMLIEGQGNFGSIDNDPAAAMRYTEARLQEISNEVLADIDKDTVNMQPNFDESLKEPTVLPTRIPLLLINGSSGIAVGMATEMPPHNLTEVINGIIAFIDNENITIEELMQYIKAPDFPTGGIIYGYEGVRNAFETGRGRIIMRADATIETDAKGKDSIVVTSIPYQVTKSEMIKRQVALVQDKRIEGITNIRDESNKDGIRVVYELRKDVVANVILNKLYQYSELQTSFNVNNIALVKGRPMMLNLKDIILNFVDHRIDVVTRRTRYELNEAEKRAHILEGLLKALDFIDEVISIIRNSDSVDDARNSLMERFGFTEIQSRAIVDMRLRQLAGLERKKLTDEYDQLQMFIQHCKNILENHDVMMGIIKEELIAVRDKYGDERRSRIEYSAADFRIEDTIADEDVVITISHLGYVKRTPLAEYRTQNRGGVGSRGSEVRDADFVEHIFVASNHNYILLFSEKGKCFWLRAFEIPEGTKISKGRAIQNLINIESDDKIKAYINVKNLSDEEYINNNHIILCSKKGVIKKTSLEAYSRPRQNGIIAITIREGDELLEAKLTNGESEVMMALKSGKAIRFNERTVRPMGRSASGVKGITLQSEKDEVIGMLCIQDMNDNILVVSEKGYGKRSDLDSYRETNRGGKGVKTINVTEKTGNLIAITNVTDDNDLMIINKSGITIRMRVSDLRILGRAAQGVRLINLREGDEIASITKVPKEEIIEIPEGEEVTSENPTQENDLNESITNENN